MLTWSEEEVAICLDSVADERDAAFWRLGLDTVCGRGSFSGSAGETSTWTPG